ncbi:MAG: YwaF family protein, partial [Acholeplasmataceae bacterium]|nr:YwaF family protein [Acholeplasmataceae bacterium]
LVKNKEAIITKKTLVNIGLILIGSMFALMPQSFLYNVFGNYGSTPKDFNIEHLFVIFAVIFLMILSFQFMKNKDQNSKNAFIFFLAVAGVFQYFYTRRESIGALPFHLCNLAIILIFISTLFDFKGLFYFTYFANVIGAILAILMPNYSTEDFFNITVIHFGFNHLYAFTIPILAVALERFEKPNLKAMFQAIGVFTVYYLTILFLNAWFNNYANVDYFFAYSDFLTSKFDISKFSMTNIQYQNVVSFTINNLEFKFFWLFQLMYYFGFIFVMFLSWYVYDLIFIAIDDHKNLRYKLKKMKEEHLILLEYVGKKGLKNRMMEEGAKMIKIKNFSKKYGKSKKYAVKDFSLEIDPGEIFGFLGHNGAGKSTTIKSMVGIQSITDGEIFIDGFSIKTQPIEAKLRIGYVSDNHAVYEKLTGREYIHYVADLYLIDKETRDERLKDLSERLKLDHALDQEVKTYSHGMKQKLVVIASLIHEPPVWILDEPLTGLDPTSSYQIKETMKEYAKKGNIVFFSSHVIEVVEKICTKIAIINQGQLQGVYEMEQLLKEGISLESLYLDDKGVK